MKIPVVLSHPSCCFATALFAAGAIAMAPSPLSAAPAGEVSAPPATSAPPPAPAPPENNTSGAYNSGASNGPGYRDPFYSDQSRGDFLHEPASRPWQLPVYFPPSPPALGAPIPLPNPLQLPSERAPAELADYVNDFFYAPLGTRIAENKLTVRQREKIKAYRAAKTALQDEIRAKLKELRTASPDKRAEELAALGRAQAPRLAALEKMAEELRAELVHGEWFQSSADWNLTRDWRLGSSRFYTADDAVNAQYQVMRAAPFYQRGLLPEQRGLLREIAMELRDAHVMRNADLADGVSPPLFFSPATARLRLPPGLPAALSDKIAAFEREKSALKQELRDAVYAQDRAYFSSTRTRTLEALADRQWPRLAALEDLAEDIRRDLALLPEPPGPPTPPPLPTALATRIRAYLEARAIMQQDVLEKIGQIKKEFAIQRVVAGKNVSGGSDLRLVISPGSQTEERMKALQQTLATFNKEMSARQAAMRAEEDMIRRQFGEAMPEAVASGRSLENLLSEYADALLEREDWARYGDYQAAMLTPGLSSEQRRVLFDGALEKLTLPLPGWDITAVKIID